MTAYKFCEGHKRGYRKKSHEPKGERSQKSDYLINLQEKFGEGGLQKMIKDDKIWDEGVPC